MVDQETLKKFDELYDETYNEVLKYVICKCANINDVPDIMQNIYLSIYKNICKNTNVTKSYIMGITKNKVNDYYRFNYKQKIITLFSKDDNIDLLEVIPDNIDLEKQACIKYDTELVWDYLKKKKAIVLKVFYLYFNMEMTIKEIAKLLDISESNVKHYLYRTLKELNTYFEDKEDKNDE